ncbi:conserved hypothetical protein [Altererythrobacter sp. B11]|uniref:hypothetical protein n=1 Tax=Altererythrobacter sp. B11 TaxID=2060312 RepID=UPI000DC6EF09|nr:hypothetical protein [Altererythrobacter sp. B11]BBC72432.1 conserved hypothetical protein [Altererythrobacter sp. B11]
MARTFALAGMLLLLAGCGGAGEDQPPAPSPGGTSAPPPTAAPSPTQAKPTPRAVVYAQGVSFGTKRRPFSTARKVVEDDARAVFPDAPFEIDRNMECGAGPMEFSSFGPLTLNFQDDRLVGWLMKEGPGMVTSDGIRPGVTLAELRGERSVELLPDSSLDGEFRYTAPDGGTIGGFASGAGPDAVVTALFAGTNCFFR